MAATISGSKLGAVAAINGPIYSTMVSMNYKGKLLCKAKGEEVTIIREVLEFFGSKEKVLFVLS